jgi:hypothetical protein
VPALSMAELSEDDAGATFSTVDKTDSRLKSGL